MPWKETKRRKCSQCSSNRGHTKLCVQCRRRPTLIRRIFIVYLPFDKCSRFTLGDYDKKSSLWLNILEKSVYVRFVKSDGLDE